MIRSRIYINIFLSLFTVFSLWIVYYLGVNFNSEEPANPNRPDEFVHAVSVTVMNKAGHWSYQFESPSALHYLDKNRTAFSSPLLDLYQEKAPMWQARAQKGEALFGNTEVHLSGGVKLTQAAGSHNTFTVINTNSAVIYPEKRIVTTTDRVIAVKPGNKVESVGMKLDLSAQTLNLFSQVEGMYQPKNKKIIRITSASAQLVKNKITGLGTTIFHQNVKLTQAGSILLTPELTVYTDKSDQLIKAIARGPGTVYKNFTHPKKPPFVATALEIQYLPLQQQVYLTGNAKAQQGINSYSAPEIRYHIDKESVATQQGRINMVILPKSFKKQDTTA